MIDLNTLLDMALTARLQEVYTALPGTVIAYNRAKKTVNVRPSLLQSVDGTAVDMPIITDVPVVFPGSNDAVIQFPLVSGDRVLLVFTSRSIEEWMGSTGNRLPSDPRQHALTDAIAIPGLYPSVSPGKVAESDGLEVRYKGAKRGITPSGNIELNGNSKAFVTHAELASALATFITALNLHTHATAGTVGTPTGPVIPLSLDISAASTSTIKTGG